jgi:hypothetical protein
VLGMGTDLPWWSSLPSTCYTHAKSLSWGKRVPDSQHCRVQPGLDRPDWPRVSALGHSIPGNPTTLPPGPQAPMSRWQRRTWHEAGGIPYSRRAIPPASNSTLPRGTSMARAEAPPVRLEGGASLLVCSPAPCRELITRHGWPGRTGVDVNCVKCRNAAEPLRPGHRQWQRQAIPLDASPDDR